MGWIGFDGKVGGIGKSMLAAAYGEALVAKSLPFAVVEADVNNNVAGYFHDVATKVWQVNLMRSEGWIELLNILDEEKIPDVILSLPAGANTSSSDNARMLIGAVKDLNRSMSFIWSMNRSPESVSLLKKTLVPFADSPITFVAVRNTFFGAAEKFKHWNNSETRQEFLKAGGLEIDFPELDDEVVERTFCAVPKRRFSANGESVLRYGERQELKRWLEKTSATFDSIAGKIGIGKW
jgi:hypothetical protein